MAAKKSVVKRKTAKPKKAARPSPLKVAKAEPARAARAKRAVAKISIAPVIPEVDDDLPSTNGKGSLVIVESPTKAKTIGKYLGRGYVVKATVGHLRDLPRRKLGVDVENGFTPEYVTIKEKENTLKEIKKAAKAASRVLIATDPDREGEAIAWHVAGQLGTKAPIRRVLFHEITKDAVKEALANPLDIDQKKVDAQQARRILDRLVGYKASPLLWKSIKAGLSAGRVQTVALRLICEREDEIRKFVPQEYWSIEADLDKDGQAFQARLHKLDGHKPEIKDAATAQAIVDDASKLPFVVTEVTRKERRRNPPAPFITSTLQQEAAKQLGFSAKRTMRAAQGLYEGVEIGEEGPQGLITYMRTDSVRVSDTAIEQAREFINANYDKRYLPETPNVHAGKRGAGRVQDAHEAIRPTEVGRRPEAVKQYLESDLFKLYQLIWRRFVASQMTPEVYELTTVDFDLGRYLFRATGSVVLFDGYRVLFHEGHEPEEAKSGDDFGPIPAMAQGDRITLRQIVPSQHFTEPPPRFSQASLVKTLEEQGIGRPSTYAAIISTLQARWYATMKERRFAPTSLGEKVWKVMKICFPDTFQVGFTAQMESELDKVEEGDMVWQQVLGRVLDALRDPVGRGGHAPHHQRRARSLQAAPRALPHLRERPRSSQWTFRALHRLRQIPGRVQVLEAHWPRQDSRQAVGRDLQGVRGADGDQDRALRRVPGLHPLSQVHPYPAGAAGDQVSQVYGGRPGRAADQERAQLLRVPAVSRLRLLGLEQAGGGELPQLRLPGDGAQADQDDGSLPQVPEVRSRNDGGRAYAHGVGRGLTATTATTATVVGGGLAGCEAAWALAERGIRVTLREMRPERGTPAHQTDRLAELVCSNSFKSVDVTNAHGLLKAEMRRLGSVVLQAADVARVPGGAALAVDRVVFSTAVHERVHAHPNITVVRGEVTALESPAVIATGPLTSEALSQAIAARLGTSALAFFDAIAPIVAVDSLDHGRLYRASRYGKGGGDDYLNAPMTEPEYDAFLAALRAGDQYTPQHEFDKTPYFEGCLPVEEMASRGRDVLRFGPMKPVGLPDPRTGQDPLRGGATAPGRPGGTDVEPGRVPDPAPHRRPAAGVPAYPRARRRRVSALREHPPQRLHQFPPGPWRPTWPRATTRDSCSRGSSPESRGTPSPPPPVSWLGSTWRVSWAVKNRSSLPQPRCSARSTATCGRPTRRTSSP